MRRILALVLVLAGIGGIIVALQYGRQKQHEVVVPAHYGSQAIPQVPDVVAAVASDAHDLLQVGTMQVARYANDDIAFVYRFRVQAQLATSDITGAGYAIVKFAIDRLIASGWNPREHKTFVECRVEQDGGTSVTGADLVRVLGDETYSPVDDQIGFRVAE